MAQEIEDASRPDADLVREIERLRKENTVLKQEREILKKRRPSSRVKSNEICVY